MAPVSGGCMPLFSDLFLSWLYQQEEIKSLQTIWRNSLSHKKFSKPSFNPTSRYKILTFTLLLYKQATLCTCFGLCLDFLWNYLSRSLHGLLPSLSLCAGKILTKRPFLSLLPEMPLRPTCHPPVTLLLPHSHCPPSSPPDITGTIFSFMDIVCVPPLACTLRENKYLVSFICSSIPSASGIVKVH